MIKNQTYQKIKDKAVDLFYAFLSTSKDEVVTVDYYFMRRNFIGQFIVAIFMLSVDVFWMIMNTVDWNSRGLFDPIPLSGMVVHITACLLFLSVPLIFKKTKSVTFVRIAVLIFYVATIYSVFSTNIGKNIILASEGVTSENIGFSLISLYLFMLGILPVYKLVDAAICFVPTLIVCIIPRFLDGGVAYSLPSNILLFITIGITYIFFRNLTIKNHKLETDIIMAKKEEETKHLAVINALGDDFTEILYLNLNENKASQLRLDNSIKKEPYDLESSYEFNLKSRLVPIVLEEEKFRVEKEFSIENIKNQLANKKIFYVDFQVQTEDGLKYYQGKIVRDDTSGKDIAIIGLRDVDEQVRKAKLEAEQLKDAKEKAEAASKAKSVFLFNMSHDIRTPMNAIMGYIGLAKKYETDVERLRDCLNKMEFSSAHLLDLINDVLDMARIESGKVTIDANPTDIMKVAEDISTMVATTAAQKGIEFISEAKNIKHKYVYLDALRLNQVILNLTSNATKYTKEGGKITSCIEELESPMEGYARYKYVLSDTGIGMSPNFLTHIFESFSREQSSTVSGIQGTGLGMAITKNLIDLMGGTINIQSELGVGTTVTVVLDFKLSEDLMENVSDDDGDLELNGMKVLLVEDNDLNREIARELLSDFGVVVSEANDGDVAVDIVKNSKKGDFDLILMDIQMPMMDGYTATEAIRHLEGHELANIPIVAMTANAFEEDRKNAYNAGMNGHLAKPIDIGKLKDTLKTFYKKRGK